MKKHKLSSQIALKLTHSSVEFPEPPDPLTTGEGGEHEILVPSLRKNCGYTYDSQIMAKFL